MDNYNLGICILNLRDVRNDRMLRARVFVIHDNMSLQLNNNDVWIRQSTVIGYRSHTHIYTLTHTLSSPSSLESGCVGQDAVFSIENQERIVVKSDVFIDS